MMLSLHLVGYAVCFVMGAAGGALGLLAWYELKYPMPPVRMVDGPRPRR